MKRKALILLGLVFVLIFLVGCAKESKVSDTKSDAKMEAEMSQLSDQELEQVVDQTNVEENKELAGQAFKKFYSVRGRSYPTKRASNVASKILRARQKKKISELDTQIKSKDALIKTQNKTIHKLNLTVANYSIILNATNYTTNYSNTSVSN